VLLPHANRESSIANLVERTCFAAHSVGDDVGQV
jgi:hypothetical protein